MPWCERRVAGKSRKPTVQSGHEIYQDKEIITGRARPSLSMVHCGCDIGVRDFKIILVFRDRSDHKFSFASLALFLASTRRGAYPYGRRAKRARGYTLP